MKDLFCQYIIGLCQNIPANVYEGLASIFCIGLVLILPFVGFRKGLKYISALLLTEYVFLLFCATVLFREASEVISGHNFHLFWSYAAIQKGNKILLPENVMNVVAFLPVGLLLGACMRYKKENGFRVCWREHLWSARRWKSGWLVAFGVGLCISVSIETLQYVTHRGFSEFDDVFHNTLGTLIGYALWKCISNAFPKKKLGQLKVNCQV